MTTSGSRKERREAIRASLRVPLAALATDLRRVNADIHSSYGFDRHGRGTARLRVRRSVIRLKVVWRTLLAALMPAPAARFQVTFRSSRTAADRAEGRIARPLQIASCLLPAASRDRWAEEWRGELAVIRGRWRRLRWALSTLRGLVCQAYILRRSTRRSASSDEAITG
jgi:hypothetical protein